MRAGACCKIGVGTSDQQLMALSNKFPLGSIATPSSWKRRPKPSATRHHGPMIPGSTRSWRRRMSRRSAGVGMASFIFSPTTFREVARTHATPDFIGWVRAVGQRGGDHAFAGSHGHGWYDLGLLAHTCGTQPTLATVAAPVCHLPRPDGAEGRAFWRQAPKVIA